MDNNLIRNGWAGIEIADKEYARLENNFTKFKIVGISDDKPGVPIWRFAQRLNDGEHLKTWYQETGDCVSMGMAQAGNYLTAAAICHYGSPIKFKLWFPPYIYGVSRTASDCGAGRLRGAGSTGAWAATAVMKHGVLFEDDKDVPKYSGRLADIWGNRGVAKEFYETASDNLVGSAARITTVDELREALINYYPCTIASTWGFSVGEKDGCKIYEHTTSWNHQMCFIAWQDDPFPAAFRLNSWGDSTGPSLKGEPLGGAWQTAESIKKELTTGVEVYALSQFAGFPSKNTQLRLL